MSNIARNSKFNININFKKSHDSYIYDNRTQKEYLDFFGMYASLPLGYNHKVFSSDEFLQEIINVASVKINNCEFFSDEAIRFDEEFVKFASDGSYKNFHYTCTGALAVESAIKTCFYNSNNKNLNVLSFKNSFHGINSLSSFITDRFWPASKKLSRFPASFSTKLECDSHMVEEYLKSNYVTCILVEPIQCSSGDIHHDKKFFNHLRQLCDMYDIPLVFDEIQVGFGSTGKLWFYQHLNIKPDIVIFGKKTQLSGIMVNNKYGKIFNDDNITRLQVTWDGDIVDMVRCRHIMKAYKEENILQNASLKGKNILNTLQSINGIFSARGEGLILAFDLKDEESRNFFVKNLYKNGMICNSTGKKSVRLRPNLALSDNDVDKAMQLIRKTIKEIKC